MSRESVAAPEPAAETIRQRTDSVPSSRGTARQAGLGNQAALHLARAGGLTVAGDALERSAGHMAAEALRAPGPVGRALVTGSGQPLPPSQRAFFEERFGADLGHVRLHGDTAAADAAHRVNARAFAAGSHIYLGARHTDVGSREGQELLAHELAHVMQQVAAHVPADLIMRAQEQGDLEAFVELLDSSTFNAIMNKAVGPVQWPVIREVLKGFAGHLAQVPAERTARIVARFGDLASPRGSWDDKQVFIKGFGWGLVKGVFSPITDLFDLLKLAVDAQQQVFGWLLTQGARALDGSLQAEAAAVMAEFGAVGQQVRKAVAHAIDNPEQALSLASQLGEQAGGQALGLARKAGASGAELILKASEAPFPQLGEGIGQVVGELISEVVLAVLTAGAANAARVGVRGVTTAARLLKSAPVKALRLAGEGVEQVLDLVRGFRRFGAGVYSEVAGALSRALEKALELLKKLFNLPAEVFDKAVARLDEMLPAPAAVTDTGMRMSVPNALEARAARPGGGGAPRRTGTTVADLRPAAAPKPKPAERYGGHGRAVDKRKPINPSTTKKPLELESTQHAGTSRTPVTKDAPERKRPPALTPADPQRYELDGPAYQGAPGTIELPEDKGEAIYAMSAKEEMYYRAIEPGGQPGFRAGTRRRFGLSRIAEDTGFDPKFDDFAKQSDVGFDPKRYNLREVRSGPRTLKYNEEGQLVEWKTTKLTPKERDATQYRKMPGKKAGYEYGHLGASQYGHLDAEFLHHGGAPQPAHYNRAVKGKGPPPWWQWEMKVKQQAAAMQNRAEDFEIVSEMKWDKGVPTHRRITLYKVTKDRQGNITGREIARDAGNRNMDSGWLKDRDED